ncbi:hypothetical protein Ddc_19445 [Ditylenchus destructor]|nr:hypothetical protein Ddc_19445 [Ditylenchus destructor]
MGRQVACHMTSMGPMRSIDASVPVKFVDGSLIEMMECNLACHKMSMALCHRVKNFYLFSIKVKYIACHMMSMGPMRSIDGFVSVKFVDGSLIAVQCDPPPRVIHITDSLLGRFPLQIHVNDC